MYLILFSVRDGANSNTLAMSLSELDVTKSLSEFKIRLNLVLNLTYHHKILSPAQLKDFTNCCNANAVFTFFL